MKGADIAIGWVDSAGNALIQVMRDPIDRQKQNGDVSPFPLGSICVG